MARERSGSAGEGADAKAPGSALIYNWRAILVVGACVLAAAGVARGEEPDGDGPAFLVTVYGWPQSISGTVAIDGVDTELDIPMKDILQSTNAGFQLYAEARWNRWFGAFDGTWASVGGSSEGDIVGLEVTLDQKLFDVRAGRRLSQKVLDEPEEGWRRQAIWDVFVGVRYFNTRPTIELTTIIGNPEPITGEDTRWDPFIGTRAGYDLSKRWSVGARGDIGGFGIGNGARFAWRLEGTVGFRIARWFSLYGGYIWLSSDTIEGEGTSRNGTDLLQQGPLIGAGFTF